MARVRIVSGIFSLLVFACGAVFAQAGLTPEMQKVMTKAEAGDIQAQFRIGMAYESGYGAPRDKEQAMKWYRAAADKGHAEAQNHIGTWMQAEKKYKEAIPWYEKAAAQQHAMAIINLGYLHNAGLGVEQDRKKAMGFYLQAADLGAAEAMWHLSTMYNGDQGGERDLKKSCVWAVRANKFVTMDNQMLMAILGKSLANLERQMPKEEVAKCKEQAEAWTPPKLAAKPAK